MIPSRSPDCCSYALNLSVRRLLLAAAFGLATLPTDGHSELIHRWSFNQPAGSAPTGTIVVDSVQGLPAVVKGQGATFSGTALTLPGGDNGNAPDETISAYLDLPNGIISSKVNLSIEAWATPLGSRNWQRLFDFGRTVSAGDGLGADGEWTGTGGIGPAADQTGSDYIILALQRGGSNDQQRLAMRLDNGFEYLVDPNLTTSNAAQHHHVVTFQDGVGNAAGGRLTWYRDGTEAGSVDVGIKLRDIEDVNNWLGRSNFTGDGNSQISYNEFRLYDHALSPAEITASYIAGPNPVFSPPQAVGDSIQMHRGQKANIDVLANDVGPLNPATVAIVQPPSFGTAAVKPGGTILYTHTIGAPNSDSFSYRVTGLGGMSAPATVSVAFANTLRIPNLALDIPTAPPPTVFQLEPAFPGLSFDHPTNITTPPGETNRVFVGQLPGTLLLIPDIQAANPTKITFLDLPAILQSRGESIDGGTFGEHGLLGVAFHPFYATNGYFFVFYTARVGNLYYQRLSRFRVQSGNPNAADPNSELILIDQLDREANHNGGDIHFGPDGYLYISVGDEGSQFDSHLNSQRIDLNFFSGLLRIDVDKRAGNLPPNPHGAVPTDGGVARYAIPNDNPWIGATSFNGQAVDPVNVRTEFYAVGFRSPWRFTFHPNTGALWCADVGQDAWEELDIVEKGGNYGWVHREGTHAGFRTPPASGFNPIDPIYDYPHTALAGDAQFKGNSITGGVFYLGTRFADLQGAYVFSDYVSGNIWALRDDGSTIDIQRITGEGGIAAFGVDPSNGDVLLVDHDSGAIRRLVTGNSNSGFPATLSATGLFADLTDLSPAPGVLPYEPNLPFWSDHAIKRRWFAIPDGTSQMGWHADANWEFPTGAVWVKHFDLELERGNPATRKRIETRLIVKTDSGSFGVSYRWNEAQTEANLVADAGEDFGVNVVENGVPRLQTWHIPSRSECRTCHRPEAGHILSFNTRQLNRTTDINGFLGNELNLLQANGFFSNATPSPNVLPHHVLADETEYSLDARARSYLAVNCAFCHLPGGPAPETWFARPELTLAQTKLILGDASSNGGNPANKLIVPGDLTHSIVLNRMAGANGFTRMPPIASNEVDAKGIALLEEWISDSLPTWQSYAGWRQEQFQSFISAEGEMSADPDGDGRLNVDEFVEGTLPWNASSYLTPTVNLANGTTTVSFPLPDHRSFQIETTTDFSGWTLWDVPGNHGISTQAGVLTISGPHLPDSPQRFFRLRIREN